MKIHKVNYHGFDHSVVVKKFDGELSYINDFPIRTKDGGSVAAAVYKAKKPNRDKGHKKYMLLYFQYNPMLEKSQLFVSGQELKDLNKSRFVDAIHCKECDLVLYSLNRHHFHKCGCKNDTFIDGGVDYTRYGAMDLKKTKLVKLDLLTDKITALKKK